MRCLRWKRPKGGSKPFNAISLLCISFVATPTRAFPSGGTICSFRQGFRLRLRHLMNLRGVRETTVKALQVFL